MVKSTIIARVSDGLPLAASMDDEVTEDLTTYKNQAKLLFKNLTAQAESKCSIDTPPLVFHYFIEFGVCYLCLCDKSYPKKLAFQYLEELQREFHSAYGQEIQRVARPVIQKTKKQYKDARTQRNLQRLNDDLGDVTRIMTKNIQEVLGRGEQLDRMSTASQNLSNQSKRYMDDSKYLNWQALYQKYGPPVVVLTIVGFVFYIRVWLW